MQQSSYFTRRRKPSKVGSKGSASKTLRPVGRSSTRSVPVDAIDWSFALRTISVDHVQRLAEAVHLPPIKVWEFDSNRYRGIDGYHRWHLAKDQGARTVSVIVRRLPPGKEGEKAFDIECVQSNLQHGLPLTRQERDRAIVQIWNRWGRKCSSSNGQTLDELGALFNLTKQRIHQIVGKQPDRSGVRPRARTAVAGPGRAPQPGGFSPFGRFSAATRRVSRLLADNTFIHELLQARHSEVLKELEQLRRLIDSLMRPTA